MRARGVERSGDSHGGGAGTDERTADGATGLLGNTHTYPNRYPVTQPESLSLAHSRA